MVVVDDEPYDLGLLILKLGNDIDICEQITYYSSWIVLNVWFSVVFYIFLHSKAMQYYSSNISRSLE